MPISFHKNTQAVFIAYHVMAHSFTLVYTTPYGFGNICFDLDVQQLIVGGGGGRNTPSVSVSHIFQCLTSLHVKEGNDLFNDALKCFIYGYIMSDIW